MKIAEARLKINESPFKDKLKWYKFYTYFCLPLSILLYVIDIIQYPQGTLGMYSASYITIYFIIFFLTVANFWGLLNLTLWGYRLNQILFVVGFLDSSYVTILRLNWESAKIITAIIMFLFYTILNLIYFAKRKSLFDGVVPTVDSLLGR